MNQTKLIEEIRRSDVALVAPKPLEHSQELAVGVPVLRRHLGPREWYQCLETWQPPTDRR